MQNTRISFLHKIFQKTLKNTKIRILYPKKYDEHTYHFTMEVSPPPPGQTDYCTRFAVPQRSLHNSFLTHLTYKNDKHYLLLLMKIECDISSTAAVRLNDLLKHCRVIPVALYLKWPTSVMAQYYMKSTTKTFTAKVF